MRITLMSILKYSAFTLIAFIIIYVIQIPYSSQLAADEKPVNDFEISASEGVFSIGEELVYNVSYSVFDLGLVRLTVIDTARRNGEKVYKAKAFVDSYSSLVSLHNVFYSEMSPDPFSYFFSLYDTKDPLKMNYVKYNFDYAKNNVYYELGVTPQNSISKKGDERVFVPQQDGLSLFYIARINVHQRKILDVPIFANEKSYNTHFNFMNKITSQNIGAVNYPIEVNEFDGKMEFSGIFGLTGEFRGFFSNDAEAIPIVAKMKVILGSVHIELIKWNRPGWVPPRAK